jgi:urea transport system substrate-binding protein
MSEFNLSDPKAGAFVSSSALFPQEPMKFTFLGPPAGPGEIGRIGEYRVLRLIGSGGMGAVFEAEDTILNRPVALKVLRPELAVDQESRERFLREAQAAAAIGSEHVVTIYHVGEVAVVPYIAMEFLHGQSLQERLHRQAPLDLVTALTVARQVAAGLAVAHDKGFIHRDIKPANLWMESDGPAGPFKRVRILDFGLARRVKGETSLTITGYIVGTPNYMSPEQAAGHEVDHRADLFSLGSVMYTIMTAELPFPGDSAMAVMMALATKTPPTLISKNVYIPHTVSTLVSRLLAKDPADRPQSAREVIAVLDAVLATLPARIPTPPGGTLLPEKSDHASALETVCPTMIQTVVRDPVSTAPIQDMPHWTARKRTVGVALAVGGWLLAAAFGLRALWRILE